MKKQQYSADSENNLEATGWDPTFEVTEQEIRNYFTPENFDYMFGRDWRYSIDHRDPSSEEEEVDFDFDSYIDAAIEHMQSMKI
jgi:hypothetical protein